MAMAENNSSGKEAVADNAAIIGDRIASSEPARCARANPWGTVLMLIGAAVTAWLLVAPRRPSRRPRRRSRRRAGGDAFKVTHYDTGVEHSIEPGGPGIANTSSIPGECDQSQTHGGTTA